MRLNFLILILILLGNVCFAEPESPIESQLKAGESLLEQTEKQSTDHAFKEKIKAVRKELKSIREGLRDGRIRDLTTPLLNLQKRIRAFPSAEKFSQFQIHISKLISSQGAFSISGHKEYGVQIFKINLPEGAIHFYFPDDLFQGDAFTYNLRTLARGNSDLERADNQNQVNSYQLTVASLPVRLNSTSQHVQIGSASSSGIDIVLKTMEGFEVSKTRIPVKHATSPQSAPATMANESSELEVDTKPPSVPVVDIDIPHLMFQLPEINQAGRLLEVRSSFDGNVSNTDVRINGNPASIVAESSRKLIVANPLLSGSQEIRIVENGKKVRCVFRNIDLRSWASVVSLATGAKAAFTVQLDSSPKLESPIVIALHNETPQIISLEGGQFQYITVNPQDLNESGSITINKILTGMHPAPFHIDTRLDTTYLFSTCRPPY